MKRNITLTILMQLILVSSNLFSQDPVACEPSFVESDWSCLGPIEEDNNNNIGRIVAVWVSDFDADYILVGN